MRIITLPGDFGLRYEGDALISPPPLDVPLDLAALWRELPAND